MIVQMSKVHQKIRKSLLYDEGIVPRFSLGGM